MDGEFIFGVLSAILGFFHFKLDHSLTVSPSRLVWGTFSGGLWIIKESVWRHHVQFHQLWNCLWWGFCRRADFPVMDFSCPGTLSWGWNQFAAFYSGKEQAHPVIMLLDLLELFYKKQRKERSLMKKLWAFWDVKKLGGLLAMLEKQNLVKRTDNDEFVLARNFKSISGVSIPSCPTHFHGVRIWVIFEMKCKNWGLHWLMQMTIFQRNWRFPYLKFWKRNKTLFLSLHRILRKIYLR